MLGPNRQLLLVDGGAYLQQEDGTWLHYASASDVGPKLGPMIQLAQDNVAGNTADDILAVATGLQKTVRPDGTTIYTGTILNSTADPEVAPSDDSIMRMITKLRSSGNEPGAPDEPGAPGGSHNDLQPDERRKGRARRADQPHLPAAEHRLAPERRHVHLERHLQPARQHAPDHRSRDLQARTSRD